MGEGKKRKRKLIVNQVTKKKREWKKGREIAFGTSIQSFSECLMKTVWGILESYPILENWLVIFSNHLVGGGGELVTERFQVFDGILL